MPNEPFNPYHMERFYPMSPYSSQDSDGSVNGPFGIHGAHLKTTNIKWTHYIFGGAVLLINYICYSCEENDSPTTYLNSFLNFSTTPPLSNN